MAASSAKTFQQRIHDLYEGESLRAHRFRYGLLLFDLVTIIFLILSSFLHSQGVEVADAVIGTILVLDFMARLWIARDRFKMLASPFGLVDVVVLEAQGPAHGGVQPVAGHRIGDGSHVDLLRFTAWLIEERHRPRPVDGADPYEKLKDRARERNAAIALAGRDIGELPAVVNAERKTKAANSFRYFCEAYFKQASQK